MEWASNGWQEVSVSAFLYDGWLLVSEESASGGNITTNFYVWGLDLSGSLQGAGGVGGLLAARLGTNNVVYSYDGNGNVSELTDASTGSVNAHYEYSPFGETLVSEGALAKDNPFRFSTKYTDDETAFVYYGYRYYAPGMGRWLSRDPLGDVVFHIYAFIDNDGLNYLDADGRAKSNAGQSRGNSNRGNGGMDGRRGAGEDGGEDGRFNPGVLSCIKQWSAQEGMFFGNLGIPGFRPSNSNDKYQHCLSSCSLSRDCGDKIAEFLGFAKEWRDEIWKTVGLSEEGASLEDFMANSKGRGCVSDPAGCECCCKQK